MNSKSLVTFVVFAYNQEHFVRQAVEGAFAQTYPNLEIILSDDHSSDSTFHIMEEMASSYRGEHRVILNRNPKNLGIGGHVNVAMERAQGCLVVFGAGDDISFPNRTSVLYDAWSRNGCPAGIGSGVLLVDEKCREIKVKHQEVLGIDKRGGGVEPSELIGRILSKKPYWLLGCSAAWSKANWEIFGPIANDVMNEDAVLSFRAALNGGLFVVDSVLVKYRYHSSNASIARASELSCSFSEHRRKAQSLPRNVTHVFAAIITNKSDVEVAKIQMIGNRDDLIELEKKIRRNISILKLHQDWWNLGLLKRLVKVRYSPFASWRRRFVSVLGLTAYSGATWLFHRLILIKAGPYSVNSDQ